MLFGASETSSILIAINSLLNDSVSAAKLTFLKLTSIISRISPWAHHTIWISLAVHKIRGGIYAFVNGLDAAIVAIIIYLIVYILSLLIIWYSQILIIFNKWFIKISRLLQETLAGSIEDGGYSVNKVIKSHMLFFTLFELILGWVGNVDAIFM